MYNKEFLLKDSETFCMAPWVHIYTTPVAEALPCCISKRVVGNSVSKPLSSLINSNAMNELRLNMLSETKNSNCETCYSHEKEKIHSFRNQFNYRYGQHIDQVLADTKPDGSIEKFNMRYFDIRFSNICNFKCRTCNSHFSSQWEQENIKRNLPYGRIPIKNNHPELLEEVLEYIPYVEYAYFAGGEPLITEEHYAILEEMIRQGRTDIKLSYNSNVSNLKFKDKDILQIWSKFKHPIEMAASIDHIGPKAEYIRHGTNWDAVASNLITLQQTSNVKLSINTVLSVFNYVSLHELYNYLIDLKIYKPGDAFSLYPLSSPEIFHSQILPDELKNEGRENINQLISNMKLKNFHVGQIKNIENVIKWTDADSLWEKYKNWFRGEILEIDKVRNESFVKTFPELTLMFKDA